jgi:hypothetical protein
MVNTRSNPEPVIDNVVGVSNQGGEQRDVVLNPVITLNDLTSAMNSLMLRFTEQMRVEREEDRKVQRERREVSATSVPLPVIPAESEITSDTLPTVVSMSELGNKRDEKRLACRRW